MASTKGAPWSGEHLFEHCYDGKEQYEVETNSIFHVEFNGAGEKTGFYFAWLGFYTAALLPPAVLGILVCLHGLVEFYTSVPM